MKKRVYFILNLSLLLCLWNNGFCQPSCTGPKANAGSNTSICHNEVSYQFQGQSVGYTTVSWRAIDPIAGVFSQTNTLTPIYKSVQADVGNTIRFEMEIEVGIGNVVCIDSLDTVSLTILQGPTISYSSTFKGACQGLPFEIGTVINHFTNIDWSIVQGFGSFENNITNLDTVNYIPTTIDVDVELAVNVRGAIGCPDIDTTISFQVFEPVKIEFFKRYEYVF